MREGLLEEGEDGSEQGGVCRVEPEEGRGRR